MDRMPRKTAAFVVFEMNHTQSFELTQLVELGGKEKLARFKQRGNEVAQRVAGVDLEDYLQWSDEQKQSLQVPMADLEEMFQIAKESAANDIQVQRLVTVTLPSVLLTYLFTIFEAYLNDVITIVYKADPILLEAVIQKKSTQVQLNFAGKTIEEQVDYLFVTTDLKDIFKDILQKNLSLNLPKIWAAANTSYNDLKKQRLYATSTFIAVVL